MNILHSKKFKHGSVSMALVITIIAIVILVNAIFTALADKYLWYVDMTADSIYTLSDAAKDLLAAEFNTEKQVKVIFCAEKDILEQSAEQRMAHNTIRDIANLYSNIDIQYVDIYTNPSAVTAYKLHTSQSINSQSIIIASTNANGTMECRVHSLISLFSMNQDTGVATGYNGEQKLISSLLAVTQDQMPIACFTVNHGEADNENLSNLAQTLYDTGYEYKAIDLTQEDFPEAARLLVIFDPLYDFASANDVGKVDELAKVDAFLAQRNAVMTFVDNETPYLPNLEQFLIEWGIQIARYDEVDDGNPENDVNLLIRDKENSLTDDGFTNKGFFVPATSGLGQSLTSMLTSKANPKTVVLQKTTAFKVPESYVPETLDDGSAAWSYSSSSFGGVRTCYDVLLSSDSATAYVNGDTLNAQKLATIGMQTAATIPFSYMRVSTQQYLEESGDQSFAYVFACASTDFAKAAALSSSYGNHELLTYACSQMGRAVVSVSLDYKPFASTEIKNLIASDATQYTIVLTVVPAAIVFIAGVVIMVRRKYA
ncbi:MAG: Gldg family protein [Clostridia bacterium]|nr:Gldg family protein [Clostridia bacterium]